MDVVALVIDFSRVLIFAKADVPSLNRHHETQSGQPGYRVDEHFYLNEELLEYLRGLSARVPIYLFTDGNLHRLPEFAPKLQGIFKAVVTAEEFDFKKNQAEAYLALAYKVGLEPKQIVFIDDSPANVQAAKDAGLVAFHYQSNAATIKLLDSGR